MASSYAFFPVETYRSSSVANGGTTIQDIFRTTTESRSVLDTKDLTNTKNLTDTKDLIQTELADIGGAVKFVIKNSNRTPIPIPATFPANPNTT